MTDLIKAVFEEQADRAPDVTRLRAALARPVRHRPRGVWVPVLAGVVVAVVLGIAATTSSPVHSPPGAGRLAPAQYVGMAYRPTALPDGFVEVVRQMNASGGWVRVFGDGTASVSLFGDPGATITPPAGPGPAKAEVHTNVGVAEVRWQATPDLVLQVSVSGTPDLAGVAEAAAATTVPDPGVGLSAPAEFGWLPDRTELRRTTTVSADPAGRGPVITLNTTVHVEAPEEWSGGRQVQVLITPFEPATTGARTPVVVRGRSGVRTASDAKSWVYDREAVTVRLGDGRWLRVCADAPGIDLAGIADGVRVGAARDYPWMGR